MNRLRDGEASPAREHDEPWRSEVNQPHERPDRSPFAATHELPSGDRSEIMVIEGMGYTQTAWERATLPEYDVDGWGTWWDLREDRPLAPAEQPRALPDRYVTWRDGSGALRLLAVEPTGVRPTNMVPPRDGEWARSA